MTRELRDLVGGVPIGRRDRELQLLQFRDMQMGVALRFLAPGDADHIRRHFAGTFTDQDRVGDWFYEVNQEYRQADS